jgi:uncharacterized protein YbaR (Trm112 family)
MFTAIRQDGGTRVTSIDPGWREREDELRALAASDRIVCPGCRQPLRYRRAGEHRRPHFAHRNLNDCPMGSQTAEVLEGKAQIYLWLKSKYAEQVEMDIDLGIPGWDRPADVVVRQNGQDTLAYWVFDRGPRHRAPLLYAIPAHIRRQVVFTESAMSAQVEQSHRLVLSRALRDFMVTSTYDRPHKNRSHLQFLNTQTGRISIYRGLHCIHAPSGYEARSVHSADLKDAGICPETGEFITSDDKQHPQDLPHGPAVPPPKPYNWWEHPSSGQGPANAAITNPSGTPGINDPLRCERCGIMTKDWTRAKLSEGTCVCRACR